jgi:lipopolysaccharide biosynthesis regulator YciM
MPTQDPRDLTIQVSQYLGMVAETMLQNEESIDTAIGIVEERLQEDPENVAAPMMLRLLRASKEMIEAHKLIDKYGNMIMSGCYVSDPSDSVQ